MHRGNVGYRLADKRDRMGDIGNSRAVGLVIAVVKFGIRAVELGQTGGKVGTDAIVDGDKAFCDTSGRGRGSCRTVGGGCATHAW